MMESFRWIDGPTATDEEWQRIDDILAVRGAAPLNRPTSRILVAEDTEGVLLGFLVLQLLPHLEPLYVKPSSRGTGLAERLSKRGTEFLRSHNAQWMSIADDPIAARLCESVGMHKVESPLYRSQP